MTKLAFVADVHVGNHKRYGGPFRAGINERCRAALNVLETAYDHALSKECDAFVVLGDLFNDAAPSPQLTAEVMAIFTGDVEHEGEVHLLVGNHELVSSDLGDHALAPLEYTTSPIVVHQRPVVVDIYDQERESLTLLYLVPYRSGDASEWLPGVVAGLAADAQAKRLDAQARTVRTVLGFHLGISDDKTSKFLRGAHDSIEATDLAGICRQHDIKHVFAGNWHDRRRWSFAWPDGFNELEHTLDVVQLGALVPTGFNNPGLDGYGTLLIWDEGLVTIEEVVGPRFVQVAKGAQPTDHMQAAAKRGCRVLVEELADDAAARVAAREAAATARSADTLQEALAGFVARMPLEDGVDRKLVLAKAKEYLAR